MNATPSQESLAKQLLVASGGDVSAATNTLQRVARLQKKRANATAPTGEVIVAVEQVTKAYKVGRTKVDALKDVSLTIHKGEFVAITGTSGSGKSTLLQLLGGLDKPSTGVIAIQGQNLAKLRDGKLSTFRNKTIGFVFQFFYLQPFLNLQTNIAVPGMFARTPRKVRNNRSFALAEQVGLGDRVKHLPRELSGGQMQRAAIARALQNNPSIILADEPTGNLDRANALAIFELFKSIRDKNGTTVVVVTHDVELADIADRTIMMSDGKIV
ncbi:MAG: ABC transporter ATP-binding protein [Patescibacteria group bacterium]|nr:ABC transporter ATP-binding protein [Patescibacteria group bacterium]